MVSGVCATSQDGWRSWSKRLCLPPNATRPNPNVNVDWDNALWRDDARGAWYLLTGGCEPEAGGPPGTLGIPKGCTTGNAYLWTSPRLGAAHGGERWTCVGQVGAPDGGAFWELPYLLPFDAAGGPACGVGRSFCDEAEQYALMVGAASRNEYWVGTVSFDDAGAPAFAAALDRPINADPGFFYSYNPHLADVAGPGGALKSHWKYISPDGEVCSSLQSALALNHALLHGRKGGVLSQPDGARAAGEAVDARASASCRAKIDLWSAPLHVATR